MRILLVFPFKLENSGGKNRAALQKYFAMAKLYPNTVVMFPKGEVNILIELVYIEILSTLRIMFGNYDVLWSRGHIAVLGSIIARLISKYSVRELHSNPHEEVHLITGSFPKVLLLSICFYLSSVGNTFATHRVFNTLQLKLNYKTNAVAKTLDLFTSFKSINVVSHNAGSTDNFHSWNNLNSFLSERRSFANDDCFILSFMGSASKWHGAEYIVEIARKSMNENLPFIFIVAGGRINLGSSPLNLINVSPCDPSTSHKIMSISDAFLLPVKDVRSSPGSPLKLYDYLQYSKPILYQKGKSFYSVEAGIHKSAYGVNFWDFNQFIETAFSVLPKSPSFSFASSINNESSLPLSHTWESRITSIVQTLYTPR